MDPKRIGAVIAAILLASVASLATGAIESRPLHFAKGTSSATVTGSLKGDQTVDYILGAKVGQTMSVQLDTSNSSNYFNVLPPGSNDVAIFVGSTSGNEWTGPLPASGDYTVRVYLMRSAARRGESANYTLTVGITGSGSTTVDLGAAPPGDAKVKGTPYHATSKVPCSIGAAPADSTQCELGVVRGKPGNAEVHVTPPGGFERVLTFSGDHVTSEGATVTARKSGDWWTIDVNDYEHYRIPEAVIAGG
jgi:hypothetical protein